MAKKTSTAKVGKIRKTARVIRASGRFCLHPFCLHVAGTAKCSMKCCRVGKRKTKKK